MDDFRFEEEVRLTEDQYASIHGLVGPRKWWKALAVTALAVGLLFSVYTLVIGVALLLLVMLMPLMLRTVPGTIRAQYRRATWLQEPFRCGASGSALWTRGEDYEVRFAWRHLGGWQERGDWLWISANHGGTVYFRLESLRKSGLESVLRAFASTRAKRGEHPHTTREPTLIDGSGFTRITRVLIDQNQTGAAVILDRVAGPGFLQLATPEGVGERGVLEFGLPNAEWAASSWDGLMEAFRARTYDVGLESAPAGAGFDTFLRVRVEAPKHVLPEHGAALLDVTREHLGWRSESSYVVCPVGFELLGSAS